MVAVQSHDEGGEQDQHQQVDVPVQSRDEGGEQEQHQQVDVAVQSRDEGGEEGLNHWHWFVVGSSIMALCHVR